VHAGELAALDPQIPRHRGAGRQHDGVEVGRELLGRHVLPDGDAGDELDALFGEQP